VSNPQQSITKIPSLCDGRCHRIYRGAAWAYRQRSSCCAAPTVGLRLNERHSNLSGKPTQRIATNEWPNAYAWVLSICLKFPWGEPGKSAQNLFQRVAAAVFAFSPRRPASTAVRSDCYASMEGILNICWALRFALLNAFRVLVLVILQSASQFGSPSRRSMRICFARQKRRRMKCAKSTRGALLGDSSRGAGCD
jgi:hypothetical protein